jgi:hypothetical protein
MSAESDRFRQRATQCRVLAGDARDQDSRNTLIDMAADLDFEADSIDTEDARKDAGDNLAG